MPTTIHLRGLAAEPLAITAEPCAGDPRVLAPSGMSEPRARELANRVRAALAAAGQPLRRAVQLRATHPLRPEHDLAAAVAVAAALGACTDTVAVLLGELDLSGRIRRCRGVLPALLGYDGAAVVPLENSGEGAIAAAAAAATPAGGLDVWTADSLADVLGWLRGGSLAPAEVAPPGCAEPGPLWSDLPNHTRERTEIHAAIRAGRGVLLCGPAESGKTMLARRVPTLLPAWSCAEAIESSAIHSLAGLLDGRRGLLEGRPFRAPHHTVSAAALLGGGDPLRPGEVSLAHGGVLFIDEVLEFHWRVLGQLAAALRRGVTAVARARERADFPARPLLVAAVNPCPCGYAGHPSRRCACSVERVTAWRERINRAVAALGLVEIEVSP